MNKILLFIIFLIPSFAQSQNYPYPVIFIHGLAGNGGTWKEMKIYLEREGWQFGDYLPYCLNRDGDVTRSNLANDIGHGVSDNLRNGDFYIIDFESLGCYQSNQAAIVKQGIAVGHAIERVMLATGKNRVVLFGHSMGGLAAREYLQNPERWVSPNSYHHVAKLITTGTPHGGSDFSFGPLTDYIQWTQNIDTESEAVRDLRTSYFYSGKPGVYLFGGTESHAVMDDDLIDIFYNVDVNCNGRAGDQIIGLNQKQIPQNLDFSIISGYLLLNFNSDGVVGANQSDLTNYKNICAERFFVNRNHVALPVETYLNLVALDEPDFLEIAYEVDVNVIYSGYFTNQGDDNCDVVPFYRDYDSYVFYIERPGYVKSVFTQIASHSLNAEVNLYDENYQLLQRTSERGGIINSQAILLNPGYYYLDLQADVQDNHLDRYQFQIFYNNQTTSIEDVLETPDINIYPNPVSEMIYATNSNLIEKYIVTDLSGKTIFEGTSLTDGVDVASIPSGMYLINLHLKNGATLARKFSKM